MGYGCATYKNGDLGDDLEAQAAMAERASAPVPALKSRGTWVCGKIFPQNLVVDHGCSSFSYIFLHFPSKQSLFWVTTNFQTHSYEPQAPANDPLSGSMVLAPVAE